MVLTNILLDLYNPLFGALQGEKYLSSSTFLFQSLYRTIQPPILKYLTDTGSRLFSGYFTCRVTSDRLCKFGSSE